MALSLAHERTYTETDADTIRQNLAPIPGMSGYGDKTIDDVVERADIFINIKPQYDEW